MRYRETKDAFDQGEVYPEAFVICTECGVAVYDTDLHDRHHAILDTIKSLLTP